MNRRIIVLLAVCACSGQGIAAAQTYDGPAESRYQTPQPSPTDQFRYFDVVPEDVATAEYVPWSQSYQAPSPYQEAAYALPADPQTEFFQEEMRFVEDEAKQPVKKKGFGGKQRDPFKTYAFWAPEQNLNSQNGDLTMSGFLASLTLPISMQEGRIWAATFNYDQLDISSNAILPDSGVPLPDRFYQINFGVTHFRELANGWQAGGMLSVGTATNEPFDDINDMTLSAVAFLNIPWRDGRDSWNLSLFYSPTGQIQFPLPGIAYVWRPNEQFEMNIGVPFSLKYRPTERRTFSFTYTPLTNVNLLVEQELGAKVVVYGGYSVNNKIYLLSGRADNADRLYFFDQRLTIGLRRELGWGFSADLSGAYLFDREIFQAQGFSSDRMDQIGIDSGALLSLSIGWSR
ncbi:DUF6268 family outer membrane beta-barrel protein [Blastopirellula marina]|uniref:DUF6268 domain-containing protein n=1 Tax=Blastopirellula marina DSM 3645 TaxID=314230 RepID=A3ZNI2_9BACT|nr:DUF6268 family outer membrane beta-barrel protein [Blastopirellula marina]EAQ81877.1 hypothetical protein DSM3645_17035 [Blastopirellula marina DSM 3645]